jgi:hypothetical protein
VGTDKAMDETFGSTCHGAGRKMSRRQARKAAGNRNVTAELANEGVVVRGESGRTVREEIPEAYKDVADVLEAVEGGRHLPEGRPASSPRGHQGVRTTTGSLASGKIPSKTTSYTHASPLYVKITPHMVQKETSLY